MHHSHLPLLRVMPIPSADPLKYQPPTGTRITNPSEYELYLRASSAPASSMHAWCMPSTVITQATLACRAGPCGLSRLSCAALRVRGSEGTGPAVCRRALPCRQLEGCALKVVPCRSAALAVAAPALPCSTCPPAAIFALQRVSQASSTNTT